MSIMSCSYIGVGVANKVVPLTIVWLPGNEALLLLLLVGLLSDENVLDAADQAEVGYEEEKSRQQRPLASVGHLTCKHFHVIGWLSLQALSYGTMNTLHGKHYFCQRDDLEQS
jgi:hypothetical protein